MIYSEKIYEEFSTITGKMCQRSLGYNPNFFADSTYLQVCASLYIIRDSIVLSSFFVLSLYYISSITCLCFRFHECWIHDEYQKILVTNHFLVTKSSLHMQEVISLNTLCDIFVLYTETLIDTHFSLFP